MSATTPIEYTFSKTGAFKNSRELNNLKITTRPAIKPIFANTGQIVKNAFTGMGKSGKQMRAWTPPSGMSVSEAGSVGPLNPMPKKMASIEQGSTLTPMPTMVASDPNRQGDEGGGGMVVPEAIAQDIQGPPTTSSKAPRDLGGKKILVFGGLGVAAIIVIYFMFFAKHKKGKRRKRRLY